MVNLSNHERRLVKVLISERSPRLAIGLSQILGKSKRINVVGRTENTSRLVELVETLEPDVVVVNADRPGRDLVELCGELRNHQVGVVLLSIESQLGPVRDALEAGANSIIAWPCHPRDLVLAVLNAYTTSRGVGGLERLSEVETEVRSEDDLKTGKLGPLVEWASRPDVNKVSPRLKTD